MICTMVKSGVQGSSGIRVVVLRLHSRIQQDLQHCVTHSAVPAGQDKHKPDINRDKLTLKGSDCSYSWHVCTACNQPVSTTDTEYTRVSIGMNNNMPHDAESYLYATSHENLLAVECHVSTCTQHAHGMSMHACVQSMSWPKVKHGKSLKQVELSCFLPSACACTSWSAIN